MIKIQTAGDATRKMSDGLQFFVWSVTVDHSKDYALFCCFVDLIHIFFIKHFGAALLPAAGNGTAVSHRAEDLIRRFDAKLRQRDRCVKDCLPT